MFIRFYELCFIIANSMYVISAHFLCGEKSGKCIV